MKRTCDNCDNAVNGASERSNPRADAKLCDACAHLAESKRTPAPVTIRPMERSDLELVLAWRNNPRIYEHFADQDGSIRWSDHVNWFETRSERREDYLIEYGERRVGVLSVDADNYVSIYVGEPPLWEHGIGTDAIEWLIRRRAPERELRAEVHENNKPSRRLFERCGFTVTGSNQDWIQYEY